MNKSNLRTTRPLPRAAGFTLMEMIAVIVLLGIVIKLGLDFYSAGESPVSALIGARVHIESHLIGSAAGLLLGLFPIGLGVQTVKS